MRQALELALEALENNRPTHHYCEDTWYSCPKHEEGCANESEGDECNCGADEANAEIDQAITAIKEALAQPEQEPVAFPRNVQEYDEDWIIDPAFLTRVKHSIDPETPYEFTPSEEQIETTLLALEVIPSALYTTPPQRKPLTYGQIRDLWARDNGLEDCHLCKIDDFIAAVRFVESAHGIKEEA